MQTAALCVVGALLALVLKRSSPEQGLLLTLAIVAVALVALSQPIREILQLLQELTRGSGLSDALLLPLYKTVGIALVVKVGGSLCRDAGESALATTVETAGAVCALVVALPLLQAVLSLLLELMS